MKRIKLGAVACFCVAFCAVLAGCSAAPLEVGENSNSDAASSSETTEAVDLTSQALTKCRTESFGDVTICSNGTHGCIWRGDRLMGCGGGIM